MKKIDIHNSTKIVNPFLLPPDSIYLKDNTNKLEKFILPNGEEIEMSRYLARRLKKISWNNS